MDEQTPLYGYDAKMALDEYKNRVLSVLVMGCLLGMAGFGLWSRYFK